jgi:hypothetical protein
MNKAYCNYMGKEIEDKEKTYHKGDLPIKSVTSTFKIQLSK